MDGFTLCVAGVDDPGTGDASRHVSTIHLCRVTIVHFVGAGREPERGLVKKLITVHTALD